MALLALDIGTKRTGVAVSLSGQLTTPVGVWATTPWASFVDQLKTYIAAHEISEVIVGETVLTAKLQTACPVPVQVVSEFATTEEARRQTGRHDHADAAAACLILEQWLESHPNP